MENFPKILGSKYKINEGLSASKFKIWGQFEIFRKLRTKLENFKIEGVIL